ncbi:pyruvate flavodoxin/ferredoxin oxidoreductase domain protein [Anaeromyxobacter sp. K]|uniref:2-oxoacid:acceptor oxidoreductase subunit alpha n=1 Tax=Anaeromyxobacter sp. (strain K) TaxID=447217 RepID=UPI00015F99E0|nr:2-oxoacid:acceptor oxidoreductase subunit alpha [Anaeromyxobacter sp. K]ACG74333.1 pyruvate flavodoxin/ferredoxin oxidoreductase domain protein [Anaeromyxobacter sp. K]
MLEHSTAAGEAGAGRASQPPLVNDFSIQVATANGSGSQSSNTVLLRSLFQMGIPVSGKNLFPSNIAGLPTWYTVRASRDGWTARKKEIDLLVAMNPETAREDVRALSPGAAVVYDAPLALASLRDDLVFYPVPFDEVIAPVASEARLRKLLRNMAYVGVLARLLGIEMGEVERAIGRVFGQKARARELNVAAARAGFEHAGTLEKRDRLSVRRMDATAGKIIVDGNSAAALGALFAGVTVVAWYPITPSSSLVETLIGHLREHRVDADGRATYAVVQAEDELAAVGMAIGAGWAGARAMTASAGPGLSLMAEFVGLAYYAEIPVVIFDVQRVGPSTGLPTRTSQGDVLSTAFLSHGDTQHVLLFPGSVEECFAMGVEAFDVAERLQTPVFVMTDLDLGMNNWMADPFPYPDRPIDRGKVLSKEDLERLGGFARYRDVDGDGIGWRTLPGTDHPRAAYFTRGTGHDDASAYSESPAVFEQNMARLARKLDGARALLPAPERHGGGSAKVGIIAYGSSHPAILEARAQLAAEAGLETDYLRVRAYPFSREVEAFVRAHERVYVVEQNRDGQLAALLKLDLPAELVPRLRGIAHVHGLPLDARSVTDELLAKEAR